MPSSPRRRIRLASVASELTVRIARLSFANLRRLDASHGQQDHTVLPYAASTAKNFNQPSAGQPKIWRRRLSAVRLRAMFAHGKPALRTPFAPDAAASTATRPNVRDDGQRPSSRDGMAGVVGVILGSRRSGIFLQQRLDRANHVEVVTENRATAHAQYTDHPSGPIPCLNGIAHIEPDENKMHCYRNGRISKSHED